MNSKASSSDLFQLIKSMSRTEKAYFKKRLVGGSSKGDKAYLKLFEVMDKMEEEDDKLLQKKLKGKVSGGLSGQKNYLYKLLLKSLTAYQLSNNPRLQIREMVNECQMLTERGMVGPALRRIEQSRRFGEKYQFNDSLLSLDHIEVTLLSKLPQKEIAGREATIKKRRVEHMQNLERSTASLDLFLKIAGLRQQQTIVSKPDKLLKELDRLVAEMAAMNISEDDQYLTRIHAMRFHQTAAGIRGNAEEESKFARKAIAIYESDEHLLKLNNRSYASVLVHHAIHELLHYRYKHLKVVMRKLKSMLGSQLGVARHYYAILPAMKFFSGETDKQRAVINEVLEFLKTEGSHLPPQTRLAIQEKVLCLAFMSGAYELAIELSRDMLPEEMIPQALTVWQNALAVRYLSHLELGNYDLLDYLMQEWKSTISKSSKLSAAEESFFKHFRKKSNLKLKEIRKQLAEKVLKEMNFDALEGRARFEAYHNVLVNWLRAEAKGVSLETVIRGNFEELS
jgi:hypothetical protein